MLGMKTRASQHAGQMLYHPVAPSSPKMIFVSLQTLLCPGCVWGSSWRRKEQGKDLARNWTSKSPKGPGQRDSLWNLFLPTRLLPSCLTRLLSVPQNGYTLTCLGTWDIASLHSECPPWLVPWLTLAHLPPHPQPSLPPLNLPGFVHMGSDCYVGSSYGTRFYSCTGMALESA